MIKKINWNQVKTQVGLMVTPKSKIIKKIHNDFNTEVDKLLESANIKYSVETENEVLLDKSKRLMALGFNNSKDVKEAEAHNDRVYEVEVKNENNEKLTETIQYFSHKYPQYKFITEDSVKKICAKYNLIYGSISRYEGFVPEKNLQQIENFKIDDKDKHREDASFPWGIDLSERVRQSWRDLERELLLPPSMRVLRHRSVRRESPEIRDTRAFAKLEIAAPLKDFNTKGMEIEGFQLTKIHIPDPVVLQPVYHNGQKHYLIVTAWGDEASDPLVVNQRMN